MRVQRNKTFKCRGERTRELIVKNYFLKPIAHVKLLSGQIKRSCTGDRLTDSYYCFWYKHKINSDDTGHFFCGYHAAKHFLSLLNIEDLPLFNPLKEEKTDKSQENQRTKRDQELSNREWNPTARQLYNALHLLIICWNTIPKYVLVDIKEELEKNYYKEPPLRLIKALNTIISKDRKGRTLQEMIEELRNKGNNIKNYSFHLLNQILSDYGIESYFG